MKSIHAFAIAATLALGTVASNAAVVHTNTGLGSADTTLTFDEVVLANQASLTNEYAAFGVSFSGAVYNPQTLSFPPATNGNQIGNFPPATNPWSILFSNNVDEAAFGTATNPNNTTVEAYLNNVLVGSVTAATDFDGTDFFQITGLVFNEIRISTTGDGLTLLDNLQFSAAPVPGTAALLALGLLVLGAWRRSTRAI